MYKYHNVHHQYHEHHIRAYWDLDQSSRTPQTCSLPQRLLPYRLAAEHLIVSSGAGSHSSFGIYLQEWEDPHCAITQKSRAIGASDV